MMKEGDMCGSKLSPGIHNLIALLTRYISIFRGVNISFKGKFRRRRFRGPISKIATHTIAVIYCVHAAIEIEKMVTFSFSFVHRG